MPMITRSIKILEQFSKLCKFRKSQKKRVEGRQKILKLLKKSRKSKKSPKSQKICQSEKISKVPKNFADLKKSRKSQEISGIAKNIQKAPKNLDNPTKSRKSQKISSHKVCSKVICNPESPKKTQRKSRKCDIFALKKTYQADYCRSCMDQNEKETIQPFAVVVRHQHSSFLRPTLMNYICTYILLF